METYTHILITSLIPEAKKCKTFQEICNLVSEWVELRTRTDLDCAARFASLSGTLEGNINALMDYIVRLEKENEELKKLKP